MPDPAEVIEAELTWTGDGFVRGVAIEVDADGRISAIGRSKGARGLQLPGRALLPGFVNAHSHAFQRGLRGRGESYPGGAGSFWTWREAMYDLVAELTPERVHAISRQAFIEMLAGGITTVGEFHYVRHHDADARDHALDDAVLAAAQETGIRLVLLPALYRTGGIGEPLAGPQRRFDSGGVEAYWERLDVLASRMQGTSAQLGAVAHSIRAVPRADLGPLHAGARRRGLVLHLHAEEQRREIDACCAAYGTTPVEVLAAEGVLDAATTIVHGTHTGPEDLARLADAGAALCICPLTEAGLGDGIADLPAAEAAGMPICVGTDANARIDIVEELRWLELVQRLAREARGVLRGADGRIATRLLDAGTRAGARSLGVDAGAVVAGAHADFAVVDLGHPALADVPETLLLDALLLGAGAEAIDGAIVGGRRCAPANP